MAVERIVFGKIDYFSLPRSAAHVNGLGVLHGRLS
jgi:hypothetical protein